MHHDGAHEKSAIAAALNSEARGRRDARFDEMLCDRDEIVERALAIFRVLQETLANAAKHAAPNRISVFLKSSLDRVQLVVKDDGAGFEQSLTKAGHYGLSNMRERANKVGGQVVITSVIGQGTQSDFSLPVSLPGDDQGVA